MSSEWRAQLDQYIDLILEVGLNLRPGQRLLIMGSLINGIDVRLTPFVRLLADAAYDRGASFVDVVWADPQLDLMRLQNAPEDSLAQYPRWPSLARLEHCEAGDAVLAVHADDPDLLAGIDPRRVAAHLGGVREHLKPVFPYISRNATNWCVVAVPVPEWAAKVLPDVPEADQGSRLWQLIFSTCRIGEDDPVASWRDHVARLTARAAYLTNKQYSSLNYSAPGTHLKVGLPPGHIWNGGQVVSGNNITFTPNLPTEEVFTSPDRASAEGEVVSTRPFDYGGNTIDGMSLTFAEGKVVRFSARTGEGILRELIQTDEGSSRLGEAALVPNSSPVSRLGVTFHNVLFDENAACHLALGDAFRFCMQDANDLTDEQFAERGGNSSKLHSDFMIGSGAMDIDGILGSGQTEPIMRSGEWAFDV